jgi:hypothetical protein
MSPSLAIVTTGYDLSDSFDDGDIGFEVCLDHVEVEHVFDCGLL